MWFNSSSSTLKGYGTAAGIPAATWASGGSLNTARYRGIGTGTQTAGLIAGGRYDRLNTEQYNGSAWTEVNNLNTGRDKVELSGTYQQLFTCQEQHSWHGKNRVKLGMDLLDRSYRFKYS